MFGYEGQGARISCSYGQGYEDKEKYLCKDNCDDDSDVLILTSQMNGTKYFIFDEKTTRVFTTTIADLRFADAGKYWCGVSRSGIDIYTEVKLEIQPGMFNNINRMIKKKKFDSNSLFLHNDVTFKFCFRLFLLQQLIRQFK